MQRTLLVLLSDTHAGHNLGLLNPETVIFEENETGELVETTPTLTPYQRYLWRLYIENLEKVRVLAGEDPVILCHNGDITQGNKYPDNLVTGRMANQVLIAKANLTPWLDHISALRVIYGTGSHVFGEGSAEMLVAQIVQAEHPALDVKSMYHWLGDVAGLSVDMSHHGPGTNTREWLKGNEARYYLRDFMWKEITQDNVPASLVVRSHYHDYINEVVTVQMSDFEFTSRIIVTPSMCGLGAYGQQAMRSEWRIRNGIAVVEIVDGEVLRVHRLVKTVDIRTREKLL